MISVQFNPKTRQDFFHSVTIIFLLWRTYIVINMHIVTNHIRLIEKLYISLTTAFKTQWFLLFIGFYLIYIYFLTHEQRKLTHAVGHQILLYILYMNYGYYHRDYLFILYHYILRICMYSSARLCSCFIEHILVIVMSKFQYD